MRSWMARIGQPPRFSDGGGEARQRRCGRLRSCGWARGRGRVVALEGGQAVAAPTRGVWFPACSSCASGRKPACRHHGHGGRADGVGYWTAPLHAVKGVQVESNGPLRPVICQCSSAAANLHYGELMPSAAVELAADKQAEMERKKKAKGSAGGQIPQGHAAAAQGGG